MEWQKTIKTKHDADTIVKILADPEFFIPLVLPVRKFLLNSNKLYRCEGAIGRLPVIFQGGEYIGSYNITHVIEFERPPGVSGKINIQAIEDKINITILLQNLYIIYLPLRVYISNKLNELEETFDEKIRLERIKRKL
ncbi:conserved hypothetical protein [Sulfolobus islandicus Y.G.57.14]|jgi:hypothetical protein|uniref:DUF3211 domain-containing protein n=2 Tax=Saccharolobus islandicus TaxID=43080 RepID=C3NB34_SACI7|nr:DUF3211 domain-containing protein [Sulfolobus islandicus]ACP46850.1 conserved hypothetical protein [Sulfolobus islandicus Y.G.57.14]ACP47470.1 conserved hypothetical protein [Sulfolobus islandicus Y.N.15.51]